jgi:hypothetical protein
LLKILRKGDKYHCFSKNINIIGKKLVLSGVSHQNFSLFLRIFIGGAQCTFRHKSIEVQ